MIPLFLYYDDFEISVPLSSAAGVYKIGAMYFSIAALPPEFSSTLDSVFLAQLIYTSDLKKFGTEKCFYKTIEEMKFLSKNGIFINVNGKIYNVFLQYVDC